MSVNHPDQPPSGGCELKLSVVRVAAWLARQPPSGGCELKRSLIGHHTHISKTTLGIRRKIEWQRCANPEARTDIKEGIASVYKLDKSAFGVYKSAEEHTVIKTKRSKAIFIFPVVIFFMASAMIYFYNWLQDMKQPIEPPKISAQAESPAVGSATVAAPAANGALPTAGQYAPQNQAAPVEKPHISPEDYEPRIDGQPHTAHCSTAK